MNIGIIGAGIMGRALAALAVKNGHAVMLSNSRHPRTLNSTAIAIGCKVGTASEAAAFGDVVMVAIPFAAYQEIPAAPLVGKVVLDANNYYPHRDGQIEALDAHTTTTSEMVATHLTGARVVKALNAILQDDLQKDGQPAGSPGRRALPIAGDDVPAKQLAAQLVDEFGFDVVDAGPLSEGWRFERARPAYCIPLVASALKDALAAAQLDIELPYGSWRRAKAA